MNLNIVRAVCKRDLASWFGNPTGYVFIILFVLFCCGSLMFSAAFFTNNLANLDTLNDPWFPLLAIVFVSASTMNIWASERSNGTHELLFTLPGSDLDLQLGKFLAAVVVYTVSLVFTLVMPIALMCLGNPDLGQLFANYLGYWLFGVMLVATSMVGSQLTNNGTVALIISILLCAATVYFGNVAGWLGYLSWQSNGPIGQFKLFAGGEIPFSGVLLFVGFTVAFFYLGLALLGRRRWRGGRHRIDEGRRGVRRSRVLGPGRRRRERSRVLGARVVGRRAAPGEGGGQHRRARVGVHERGRLLLAHGHVLARELLVRVALAPEVRRVGDPIEERREGRRVARAPARLGVERLLEHARDQLGHARPERGHRRGRPVDDGLGELGRVLEGEVGRLARQRVPEHERHAVEVDALVRRGAAAVAEELGRDPAEAPDESARRGHRGHGVRLRGAEVHEHGAVLREHHVGGLHVAVDEAGAVDAADGVEELLAEADGDDRREGARARDVLHEVLAVHVLDGEVGADARVDAGAVHLRQVEPSRVAAHSRSKRLSVSGSRRLGILSATSPPSWWSMACRTTPMPPRARTRQARKRPSMSEPGRSTPC